MTLECSQCHARYSIDDALIPPQGARVKCRKCASLISVPPPAMEPAPQDRELIPPPSSTLKTKESNFIRRNDPSSPASLATDSGFERSGPPAHFGAPPSFAENLPSLSTGSDFTTTAPAQSPASAAAVAPVPEPVEAPTPSAPFSQPGLPVLQQPASAPPSTSIPSGLQPEERSKHEKARRLARVLASDIAIYNREKRDRGIKDGNLVAVLGYEIKKSWDIYKERVGTEFANSTPYFREALNEMLAEGNKIF